jgi:hypothetical protein
MVHGNHGILSPVHVKQADEVSVALLHWYGVDCLYREGLGMFVRLAASAAALEVWTVGSGQDGEFAGELPGL